MVSGLGKCGKDNDRWTMAGSGLGWFGWEWATGDGGGVSCDVLSDRCVAQYGGMGGVDAGLGQRLAA